MKAHAIDHTVHVTPNLLAEQAGPARCPAVVRKRFLAENNRHIHRVLLLVDMKQNEHIWIVSIQNHQVTNFVVL